MAYYLLNNLLPSLQTNPLLYNEMVDTFIHHPTFTRHFHHVGCHAKRPSNIHPTLPPCWMSCETTIQHPSNTSTMLDVMRNDHPTSTRHMRNDHPTSCSPCWMSCETTIQHSPDTSTMLDVMRNDHPTSTNTSTMLDVMRNDHRTSTQHFHHVGCHAKRPSNIHPTLPPCWMSCKRPSNIHPTHHVGCHAKRPNIHPTLPPCWMSCETTIEHSPDTSTMLDVMRNDHRTFTRHFHHVGCHAKRPSNISTCWMSCETTIEHSPDTPCWMSCETTIEHSPNMSTMLDVMRNDHRTFTHMSTMLDVMRNDHRTFTQHVHPCNTIVHPTCWMSCETTIQHSPNMSTTCETTIEHSHVGCHAKRPSNIHPTRSTHSTMLDVMRNDHRTFTHPTRSTCWMSCETTIQHSPNTFNMLDVMRNDHRTFTQHVQHVGCHAKRPSNIHPTRSTCWMSCETTIEHSPNTFNMLDVMRNDHRTFTQHVQHVGCHAKRPSNIHPTRSTCWMSCETTIEHSPNTFNMLDVMRNDHRTFTQHVQHMRCWMSCETTIEHSPNTFNMLDVMQNDHRTFTQHVQHVGCHAKRPSNIHPTRSTCWMSCETTIEHSPNTFNMLDVMRNDHRTFTQHNMFMRRCFHHVDVMRNDHRTFIQHFHHVGCHAKRPSNIHPTLPPCWMSCETTIPSNTSTMLDVMRNDHRTFTQHVHHVGCHAKRPSNIHPTCPPCWISCETTIEHSPNNHVGCHAKRPSNIHPTRSTCWRSCETTIEHSPNTFNMLDVMRNDHPTFTQHVQHVGCHAKRPSNIHSTRSTCWMSCETTIEHSPNTFNMLDVMRNDHRTFTQPRSTCWMSCETTIHQ